MTGHGCVERVLSLKNGCKLPLRARVGRRANGCGDQGCHYVSNVVSELRRPRPHRGVVAWLASVALAELFLSAVTMGELQAGVERARQQDPAKSAVIEAWIESLAESYGISRGTARRVLTTLRDEGYVYITPGWGTFVAESPGGQQR